ncbi:MAG: TlpA disulfide reductase family protein [Halieaceae bacterium]|jgi:thiol-disulfide isomerase/thioredoxin|nr:TlpA disulfide reductase family protein [Halieaceae bacterium]
MVGAKTLNTVRVSFVSFILAGLLALTASPAWTEARVSAPAPSFALPGPDGSTRSLADYSGDIVYVDFWASWCGPCLKSFPVMEALHQRYADQGLSIVAINVDQRREDADAFLSAREASFAVLFDDAGVTPQQFGVKGMPTSFLIDREGLVRHIHQGFRKSDGEAIERLIQEALAE